MPWTGGVAAQAVNNVTGGFADYNDLATASSPIVIPNTLVNVDLTNDGLGEFTNLAYLPAGVTKLWDTTTGLFDFSELSLGDTIDIRIEIEITTALNNAELALDLLLGVNTVPYTIAFSRSSFKNAGTYVIDRFNGIYMGDLNTLNGGAKFVLRSDIASTVKVSGWYVRVLRRN